MSEPNFKLSLDFNEEEYGILLTSLYGRSAELRRIAEETTLENNHNLALTKRTKVEALIKKVRS